MLAGERIDGVILPAPLGDAHELTDRLRDEGIMMVAAGSVRSTDRLPRSESTIAAPRWR